MATIYKASGEILNVAPQNGTDFSLEEMQAIVNGYIECVYLNDEFIMVVNEEGKCDGLPINPIATEIFCMCFPNASDIVVGDVLVCNQSQIK